MRPISWLHVSDIHMSMRDAWSQDLLLTAMCRRIEKLREDQELGGWSSQIDDAIARIGDSLARLQRLAIGGTAVGNGINAHPEFAKRVVATLADETGFALVCSDDHFRDLSSQDAAVEMSGQLNTLAVALTKIANDLRWMNSGPLTDDFDCGKASLDAWLVRLARQAQASSSAKTFVVADGRRVVGYFSLAVGQVDSVEAPERIRKGIGRYPIPVVLLARLAVDRSYQGQGIGVGMLQDAIRRTLMVAEQADIRAVLTHPIDADAFYQRFGFVPSPVREGQLLLLLLKDARRVL